MFFSMALIWVSRFSRLELIKDIEGTKKEFVHSAKVAIDKIVQV